MQATNHFVRFTTRRDGISFVDEDLREERREHLPLDQIVGRGVEAVWLTTETEVGADDIEPLLETVRRVGESVLGGEPLDDDLLQTLLDAAAGELAVGREVEQSLLLPLELGELLRQFQPRFALIL